MDNEIYQLCNEKGYFTCGSTEQYQKMFDLVNTGAHIHDIALVIWLCSDNVKINTIESEIAHILEGVRR